MNLTELIQGLDLKVCAAKEAVGRPVGGGYASDLLSDVIAHGRKDDLWVTMQIHPNIVAVAVLKELAGILLVNGREPAPETVERAEKEGVPILVTRLNAFDCVGKLYRLGITGS